MPSSSKTSRTRLVAAFAAASSRGGRVVVFATATELSDQQTGRAVVARSKNRRRRWSGVSLQVLPRERAHVLSLQNSTARTFGVPAAVHGATQQSADTRFAGLASFATNSTWGGSCGIDCAIASIRRPDDGS